MIFIFFFFSLQKSLRVNKIENSNTTVIIIVPTDSQSIFSDICKSMKEFIQKNFSSISTQNITYADWNDKYGITVSEDQISLALFRYNKFLEIYPGLINFANLHKYLTLSLYSHVITIKDEDIPLILKTQKRFFILKNDHIYYEYENAAFLYKYSKVNFFFIKGTFSLVYYDNVNQCSRKYDFSRSITIFIKSCEKINKKTIKKFYDNIEKNEIKKIDFLEKETIDIFSNKSYFHLFAITNSLNKNKIEIDNVLSSLKKNFHRNGNFSIIDWQNRHSQKILKNCRIRPNKLTYAITYRKNRTDFCYFYPYETVNNDQNFYGFFEKFINNAVYSNFLINQIKVKSGPKLTFNSPPSDLSKIIPDKENSIVAFISNLKSVSNNKACEAYYLLKYRLSFLKGFKFIEIETNKNKENLPFYVPVNDNFPLFVIWERDNRNPHIFKGEVTNQNLLNFALKYIAKK